MEQAIPYNHPAWVEVDLGQFKKNIKTIREFVGGRKICIPIKANAYGHGLVPIARAAAQAGVDYLAVSCLQEGILLRQANIDIPILVFGVVYESQILELLNYDLEFTIASLYKAKLVEKIGSNTKKKCKVHMEVDTGMQRTGMRPETAKEVFHYLEQSPCFEVTGVYTHLATGDNPDDAFAHEQIKSFQKFLDENISDRRHIIRHMANSGGTCFYPASHLDMVRPGKMTYGYFTTQQLSKLCEIAPVFSVKAHISYFKVVEKERGVGYGHTHKTRESTRIVTIPIGYGDGYRRALSNKAEVLIRGKRYPIVGNICMDQFMVDIHRDEAYVGEEVILVGKQGAEEITLGELARLCATIPSEILCNFNNRLPHFYKDSTVQFWEFDSLKHSTWEMSKPGDVVISASPTGEL